MLRYAQETVFEEQQQSMYMRHRQVVLSSQQLNFILQQLLEHQKMVEQEQIAIIELGKTYIKVMTLYKELISYDGSPRIITGSGFEDVKTKAKKIFEDTGDKFCKELNPFIAAKLKEIGAMLARNANPVDIYNGARELQKLNQIIRQAGVKLTLNPELHQINAKIKEFMTMVETTGERKAKRKQFSDAVTSYENLNLEKMSLNSLQAIFSEFSRVHEEIKKIARPKSDLLSRAAALQEAIAHRLNVLNVEQKEVDQADLLAKRAKIHGKLTTYEQIDLSKQPLASVQEIYSEFNLLLPEVSAVSTPFFSLLPHATAIEEKIRQHRDALILEEAQIKATKTAKQKVMLQVSALNVPVAEDPVSSGLESDSIIIESVTDVNAAPTPPVFEDDESSNLKTEPYYPSKHPQSFFGWLFAKVASFFAAVKSTLWSVITFPYNRIWGSKEDNKNVNHSNASVFKAKPESSTVITGDVLIRTPSILTAKDLHDNKASLRQEIATTSKTPKVTRTTSSPQFN